MSAALSLLNEGLRLEPRSVPECHEDGGLPPGSRFRREPECVTEGGPVLMLHVGLDLSRARLDVHVMDQTGTSLAVTTAAPDVGGLASLAHRLGELGQPITAVIESMNGARFVHD